ncbi:STAS domain-containing protein [Actinoplanes sp. NPDC051411]|uniref:STAS domain-containing protein n=1 Tax=Actinoplanes sp. NPDC051411 TaxID=3155522 RepID=UPI00341AACD7
MPDQNAPARATVFTTRQLLLTASGEVDATIAAEIGTLADHNLGPEIDILVVDLTAVTALDDRAAAALINLADHLRAAGLPTEFRAPATTHPALAEAAAQGRLRMSFRD